MANWLIYDCKILRAIPQPNELPIKGIEYCKGWGDAEGMGISCIGWATSYGSQGVFVLNAENPWMQNSDYWAFHELVREFNNPRSGVISFRSYCDTLCRAYLLPVISRYDLLYEIQIAASGDISSDEIDELATYNQLLEKTFTEESYPILWQQGRRQEVIDSAYSDITVIRHILELGLKGELINPRTTNTIQLSPLGKDWD